jgi:hypothetical protein
MAQGPINPTVLADKVQESSREPTDTTATINVQSDPLFVTVI